MIFNTSQHPPEPLLKYKEQPMRRPGFFKRWLARMVRETNNYESKMAQPKPVATDSLTESLNADNAIRFNLYIANGGKVIETHRYDRKTDRGSTGLYVISNNADLGQEIEKIITMEGLRV